MKFVLFATLIWSILDSGWSITDEEYIQFKAGLAQIQVLTKEMTEVKAENKELRLRVDHLEVENNQMRKENVQLSARNHQVLARVDDLQVELNEMVGLTDRVGRLEESCGVNSDKVLVQNTTIEERVTVLEVQMTEVLADVTEVKDEIAFLFDEQVIQDERIFILEQETTDLDTRVEVLEADGGGGGNVTALEERVKTLEGTAAQHETDIEDLESATSNLDGRVETIEGEVGELETRLTAAEIQIEDLQATDVELDSRISDLEEGVGGTTNETRIAFRAVMDETDNDNIPDESTVLFSDVQLNEGNGYDAETGVFTVPSGGAGYYYFATHFTVYWGEIAWIDLRVNNVAVCTMSDDNQQTTGDRSNGGCNTVSFLLEGDEVKNVYRTGTDSTPVYEATNGVYNGFNGFRI